MVGVSGVVGVVGWARVEATWDGLWEQVACRGQALEIAGDGRPHTQQERVERDLVWGGWTEVL
jgi:hypothetical protein